MKYLLAILSLILPIGVGAQAIYPPYHDALVCQEIDNPGSNATEVFFLVQVPDPDMQGSLTYLSQAPLISGGTFNPDGTAGSGFGLTDCEAVDTNAINPPGSTTTPYWVDYGYSTTTSTTTLLQIAGSVDNPSLNLFLGFMIFFMSGFSVIAFFRKK